MGFPDCRIAGISTRSGLKKPDSRAESFDSALIFCMLGGDGKYSLIPQTIDWVGKCRPDRLVAHRQQSNDQSQQCRQKKWPQTNTGLIGKILQPSVHHYVCDRPGDKVGHKHPFGKLFAQQQQDIDSRRPQDFPHADLLCSFLSCEGSQTEEPQTGDKDG